jgi:hypothetical protein
MDVHHDPTQVETSPHADCYAKLLSVTDLARLLRWPWTYQTILPLPTQSDRLSAVAPKYSISGILPSHLAGMPAIPTAPLSRGGFPGPKPAVTASEDNEMLMLSMNLKRGKVRRGTPSSTRCSTCPSGRLGSWISSMRWM